MWQFSGHNPKGNKKGHQAKLKRQLGETCLSCELAAPWGQGLRLGSGQGSLCLPGRKAYRVDLLSDVMEVSAWIQEKAPRADKHRAALYRYALVQK